MDHGDVAAFGIHHRYFDQISVAAKSFSRELDTQRLATTVADQAVQLLGCRQATVGLFIDEQLQFLSTRDWKQQTCSEFDPADEALMRAVVPHREARIFDRNRIYHNAICAPSLNHQSRVIAVIGFFGCRRAGLFNQADLRAAECLADLASTAFDRSRIFDRMNEWTSSLETLLAFNAAVNQHLSPDQLLRRLIQHAVQFLKSSGGMAGLAVTAEADRVVMRASDYFCDGQWETRPCDWGPHQGTAGTVLESEFPAVIKQLQRIATVGSRPDHTLRNLQSALCSD